MFMTLISCVKSCVMKYGARRITAMFKTWEELMVLSSLSPGFVSFNKSVLSMECFSGADHVRGGGVGEGHP